MGHSRLIPPVSASDSGVYVHFPYCSKKKCDYCSFFSRATQPDDVRYADAIAKELALRSSTFLPPFRSLYFGGGTPSLWSPDQVARIIRSVTLVEAAEITLEANPSSDDHFEALASAGVTRFSIGLQSLKDKELAWLGRSHDAKTGCSAVRRAKQSGASISVDLIYGLPGQSSDNLRANIDGALALEPDHISAYLLTIEPDTPLARRVKTIDEDRTADLFELTSDLLARAGFFRYEISSFAPRGNEAIHNSLYWVGGPYLGLGAGAHSYRPNLMSAKRWANIDDPEAYMRGAEQGALELMLSETLSRAESIGDRLMLGMRTVWGIDLEALARETNVSSLDLLRPALRRLEASGLIQTNGSRHAPTNKGFLMNNVIARELLEAARSIDAL